MFHADLISYTYAFPSLDYRCTVLYLFHYLLNVLEISIGDRPTYLMARTKVQNLQMVHDVVSPKHFSRRTVLFVSLDNISVTVRD